MTQEKTGIILKFGGASVNSPEAFSAIANIILYRKKEYQKVIVVVSAMGNTTDELIALAYKVNARPPRRELDMLISVGERMSISLLAMSLAAKGAHAISFTGSQSGILTTSHHFDAKIINVKPHRLLGPLEQGKIVIVAGFQGVSLSGEITTLGRGGSDTTAVALAIALQAQKVEFFKDVDGVFDCDPKTNSCAQLLPKLTYQEAYKMMTNGAKVLHARCIQLAKKHSIPLKVSSFYKYDKPSMGTAIFDKRKRKCAFLFEAPL
jgi:aspartate kinase